MILRFPELEKCSDCAGHGLTWNVQRRTKRQQVASSCHTCHGTGRVRSLLPVIMDSNADGDPHESEEYLAHIEKLAADCGYDDGPCDGCLAGGLCDCDLADAHPLYDDDFLDAENATAEPLS